MSSDCQCLIAFDASVSNLYSHLRQHCIIHDPPYDLRQIVAPFLAATRSHGRPARIIVDHRSRSVTIQENDIRHHVLQTAVHAFQNHRLQMPSQRRLQMPSQRRLQMPSQRCLQMPSRPQQRSARRSIPNRQSGQTCSVCMEVIMTDDLQYLPCAHVFHRECISKWFDRSTTCPVCRTELT